VSWQLSGAFEQKAALLMAWLPPGDGIHCAKVTFVEGIKE
jgi:hypothetical protein